MTPSCVLHAGEHPFIKQDSFVVYAKARIEDANKILNGVKSGKLISHDPMLPDIFEKICVGLDNSRHTQPKVRKFFAASK